MKPISQIMLMRSRILARITPVQREVIDQIKAYARDNYAKGWDVVYEAYDDIDLYLVVRRCKTLNKCIGSLKRDCNLWQEKESAVLNEVF